jgi:hypothetical protein
LFCFQYTNIYVTTSALNTLIQDERLQKECLNYIGTDEIPSSPLSFAKVLKLYCHLQYGINMKEFCKYHQTDLPGIDMKRWIGFGVLKGFIRRIHKYPIYDGSARSLTPVQQQLYS